MQTLFSKVLLSRCPVSPLKMRTVVDLIRGQKAADAIALLQFHSKKTISEYLLKLLKAGVASWKEKHSPSDDVDLRALCLAEISVNRGSYVKRVRAASRGRVHRIQRPYSHVILVIEQVVEGERVADEVENISNNKKA